MRIAEKTRVQKVDERVRDGTQIILRRETRNRYLATPKIYTVITAGILDHHTNIDHGVIQQILKNDGNIVMFLCVPKKRMGILSCSVVFLKNDGNIV
jgi:hypothetical protein